jgi:hypothetical protein
MEVAIKNIASFAIVDNLAVNQLMEHKVATIITAKVASMEGPSGPW